MVGTLIESRAARQRRTASSVASVILHAVVIGGAVLMTARESISAAAPDERVKIVVFDLPKDEPVEPPPAVKSVALPMTAVAPRALVLLAPTIVPTEIPPIDLSVDPTPTDFSDRRISSATILCDRDCAPGTAAGTPDRDTWSANDVMMRLRDDPVPPRYPESLRRAGIDGSVLVKFVVDTTGRVDMASIEVVRSTHDAFTAAVRESLARMRFHPSRAGNRKVPATAMMPFQFTLR
jgi:periplasmic protein TonB